MESQVEDLIYLFINNSVGSQDSNSPPVASIFSPH